LCKTRFTPMFSTCRRERYEVLGLNEQAQLLKKKHELEQLIQNNEELYQQSLYWSGMLPANMVHPADLAGHLQVLHIELDRINNALDQYRTEQLS